MPDPFRRQPNGGPMRGPTPRTPPPPRPRAPPPGGTAGIAQQTAASQLGTVLFAPGFGRAAARPRRRGPSTPAPRRRGKGAKFVKGSAAAKRHMAKLRRMQKRKR
jgi:hypothetical protein